MATSAQTYPNRDKALTNCKHGFRGDFYLAPAESAEEWEQLKAAYIAEWQPDTESETNLVQMLAENFWLRKRSQMKLLVAEHQLATNFDGAMKLIEMFARSEAMYERAFHKCLKQLQEIRKQKEKERIGFERNESKQRDEGRKNVLHDIKVGTAQAKLERLQLGSSVQNRHERRHAQRTAPALQQAATSLVSSQTDV